MQSEIWNETRTLNHYEVIGGILSAEFCKETVYRYDLSYLGAKVDRWWIENKSIEQKEIVLSSLHHLLLDNIKDEHLKSIKNVGLSGSGIAAVLLEYMFNQDSKELALFVHEAMAKIAGIVDIKYPYEEHKELFPKEQDGVASDWGKGLGIIRPHSDDLYEERDINLMSITVCKDITRTPTWFWLLKDVVGRLTDEELGYFALSEATYYSGTNVEGRSIQKKKPILRIDASEGLALRLDFRIDDSVGPRMRIENKKIFQIFEKMRVGLRLIRPYASNPSTGSVGILANFKILHGRSYLNPVMLYEGESSRILYRSKGIR